MTEDARFEDGAERPLRLVAQTADDVPVISALVQDAVFPASEMTWDRGARRFALLLNRFRWEDRARAERQGRAYERVQSLLVVGDVLSVASSGVDRRDDALVVSLLSVTFTPGADGSGEVLLTMAGDGAIRLTVECIDLALRDVTRPYRAPSGKAPGHDI
ncbi:DUF2948 domain-containing protein [Meridianimarinicoccus roseus]|uniref:DUF2948 domain-containing protein n=1 Tax=Meridianimarinicoccus roseus TaxID=2072018 RepID=A0A2V2LC23_9RHOB|nr:DUF2948 family protein [Meridianimarinicoccus roseus]PWR03070.1 DUF2948 domain-containing protein [Meridianimarinicoccus roseus]